MATDKHDLEIDTVGAEAQVEESVNPQAAFLKAFPDRVISSILVLIAMESEALPLVTSLGLAKDDPAALPLPVRSVSWRGDVGGAKVVVVQSGKCSRHGVDLVGTVPAAIATYAAISAFKPDLVLSVGTAGGFRSRGAGIGDVFLSSSTVNHDRRIPIPGFDSYGVGSLPSLPTPALLRESPHLRAAVISSGNSLDATPEDLARLDAHGAAVKEMEAAAVAWTADLFGVPLLGIKAITDVIDSDRPAQEEFLENLAAAAQALKDRVPPIIEFLAGKRYSEA